MKCHWFQCGGWIKPDGNCGKCGRTGNLPYELGIKAKQDQHNILEPEHGPLWKGKGHEAGYQKKTVRKPCARRGANKRRTKSGSRAKAKWTDSLR
jgi:hypothetical protein